MILFLVYLGLCLLIAMVGKTRPFGFWGYFFSSFFLSPLIGCLLLLASGRNWVRRSDRDRN
jgi:hypothetical protein